MTPATLLLEDTNHLLGSGIDPHDGVRRPGGGHELRRVERQGSDGADALPKNPVVVPHNVQLVAVPQHELHELIMRTRSQQRRLGVRRESGHR